MSFLRHFSLYLIFRSSSFFCVDYLKLTSRTGNDTPSTQGIMNAKVHHTRLSSGFGKLSLMILMKSTRPGSCNLSLEHRGYLPKAFELCKATTTTSGSLQSTQFPKQYLSSLKPTHASTA